MITIYCGKSLEPWGPESLKTGIGGSETAVIHLTNALAHNHHVRVFNDYPFEGFCFADMASHPNTYWSSYQTIDVQKTTDTLIVWRRPEMILSLSHLKADRKILWLHDLVPELEVLPYIHFYQTIVVSSTFHRDQYPNIPGEKIVVIPLGIDAKAVELSTGVRNPYKICSFSAYDRGIVVLLESWTKYKLMFPDLELVVGYGWHVLEKIAARRKDFIWFKDYMEHLFNQEGITHLGRVSQSEVLHHMKESQLWVYPSVWPETFCLTGIQAQASGAVPVTSTYAALKETVTYGFTGDNEKVWSERLIHALKNPQEIEAIREAMVPATLEKYDWGSIAEQWSTII